MRHNPSTALTHRRTSFQEFFACGLHSANDDLCDPAHDIETQIVIFFAQDEQMTAVENDGSRGLHRTSAKMPGKGRKEPRPAKQLAIT